MPIDSRILDVGRNPLFLDCSLVRGHDAFDLWVDVATIGALALRDMVLVVLSLTIIFASRYHQQVVA